MGMSVTVICSALINTHILVNGAMPSLSHFGRANEKIFIFALLLQPELYLSLLAAMFTVALLQRIPKCLFPVTSRSLSYTVAGCLGLFLAVTSLLPTPVFGKWYAKNILEFNFPLRDASKSRGHVSDGRTLVDSRTSGKQRRTTNVINTVILIVIEGLSRAHVDAGWLPNLKALENRGLLVDRFLNHQRQTNRGLFSLFCGAYPNFQTSIAKPDLMAMSGLKQFCLPQALEQAGIETAYIQSADLNYMSKDLFAKAAGFTIIKGRKDVSDPEFDGPWGVDDRSLFKEGLSYIEKSKTNKKFLAMLTTGTHSPFTVPGGKRGKREAFGFADKSLAWLVTELEQNGKLEDTVIIVTSDESSASELPVHGDLPPDNLGYLLALGGGLKPSLAKGLYGQVDIPATVADLFMQPDTGSGVSLLREPAPDRILYAGNTFKREYYEVTAHGIARCTSDFHCNPSDAEPRMSRLIAMNDINSAANDNVLASMYNRSFNTEEENAMVFGRLITNRPRGTTLIAKIDLNTSQSPEREEDKEVVFLGWDCEENLRNNLVVRFKVPGGRESNPYIFGFPQIFEHQCHKLWVYDLPGNTNSCWELAAWSLETAPEEKAAIERIAAEHRNADSLLRVAHAGGGLNGKTCTNSIAAMDYNYRQGFRLFEIDFIWTSDGQLVCGNDWKVSVQNNHGFSYDNAPSFEQFKQDFLGRNSAPCTLKELHTWLLDNPHAFLVTDIKVNNFNGLAVLKTALGALSNQIIPQIYEPGEYWSTRKLGYEKIILTLDRYHGDTCTLLEEIEGMNFYAITVPRRRATSGLGVLLGSLGIATYTDTVNESNELNYYLANWGIDEVYTDCIAPQ